MNSYQRRQRRRRIVFGFRKLATAARQAGGSIEEMARGLERVNAIFVKMIEQQKAA